MNEKKLGKCPYCGSDIFYEDSSPLVKCIACGSRVAIASFLNEQIRLEKTQEEAEEAKKALTLAQQEKTIALEEKRAAEERVFQTLTQLENISNNQNEQQDALTELIAAVLQGQETTTEKLQSIQEITGELLESQNNILGLMRFLKTDTQETNRLIGQMFAWANTMDEKTTERLIELKSDSIEMQNNLQNIDKKIDRLDQSISDVSKQINRFESNWKQSKLNELANLYHEAEKKQRNREFDQAEIYYRKVLIKEGASAEVYWRLILCHYCVEYQQSDNQHWIPTILYPSQDDPRSLPDWKDLQEQCGQSEELMNHYESLIKPIEEIVRKYCQLRQVVNNQVFICVKQKENAHWTTDSDTGSELYDFITSKKLSVFNSRRIRIPAGEPFEPYIIAALMSAKLMIVIGTTPEHMEARWVKNEWTRFQWLQNREKKLNGKNERRLVCYLKGMEPSDIPSGLHPDIQAIEENAYATKKIEDLLEQTFGPVKRSDDGQVAQKNLRNTDESQKIEEIYEWMDIALEIGQYSEVLQQYNSLIKQTVYLNQSRIHLYALCAQRRITNLNELAELENSLETEKLFQLAEKKAASQTDKELIERLKNSNQGNIDERETKDKRDEINNQNINRITTISETITKDDKEQKPKGSGQDLEGDYKFFHYRIKPTGGVVITGLNKDIKEAVIPEEIDNQPVIEIGEEAFAHCDELTSIVFSSKLQNIGTRAFISCESLTKVTFGEQLSRIGDWAFAQCSALTELNFYPSLVDIGDYSFFRCGSLSKIKFNEGTKRIGNYSFSGCVSLNALILPDDLKEIGVQAFSNCRNLLQVQFPVNLKLIGDYAFYNCASQFNASVAPGSYAENWCTENRIPFKMPYKWIDKGTSLELAGYSGHETKITIPAQVKGKPVKAIAQGCFKGNTNLQEIRLPEGIVSIGTSAFNNCSALVTIHLPSTLTIIELSAFSFCSRLSEITIPGGVARIGNNALEKCRSLKKAVICNGVQSIGPKCFIDCSALEQLELPESLRNIGMMAFTNCYSLERIKIPNRVNQLEPSAFENCKKLKHVELPSSLTYMGSKVFDRCSSELICYVQPNSYAEKECRSKRIKTRNYSDSHSNGKTGSGKISRFFRQNG